jgi:hypothetical protein
MKNDMVAYVAEFFARNGLVQVIVFHLKALPMRLAFRQLKFN